MMKAIHAKLAPLKTERCPVEPDKNLPKPGTVTWTRPELVCEVRYTNWTDDGRLRAPVFAGLRPDIDPRNASAEAQALRARPVPPLLGAGPG